MKFFNESTDSTSNDTALELACCVSAPDEVITLLAEASCRFGYPKYKIAGSLLVDHNRDLQLIKKVYDGHWEWYHQKEHLFHPQKEKSSYH